MAGQMLLTGCAILQADVTRGYRAELSIKDEAGPPIRKAMPKATGAYRSATAQEEQGACGSVDQCALLLRLMVEDPHRTWMRQRPSPQIFANGTRLFAYRALRHKLSCGELEHAANEVRDVTIAFKNPVPGVAAEQIVRVQALSAGVEEELGAERAARCVY
jgi:hypothetical protein